MKKQLLQKTQVFFSNTRSCTNLAFVPKHKSAVSLDIQRLQDFVGEADKLLVITGAGISTESGIPDYRKKLEFTVLYLTLDWSKFTVNVNWPITGLETVTFIVIFAGVKMLDCMQHLQKDQFSIKYSWKISWQDKATGQETLLVGQDGQDSCQI